MHTETTIAVVVNVDRNVFTTESYFLILLEINSLLTAMQFFMHSTAQ